jgi:hypothetical protein
MLPEETAAAKALSALVISSSMFAGGVSVARNPRESNEIGGSGDIFQA